MILKNEILDLNVGEGIEKKNRMLLGVVIFAYNSGVSLFETAVFCSRRFWDLIFFVFQTAVFCCKDMVWRLCWHDDFWC